MTKPIKSLYDLTRCTACRAHIRAADRPSSTVCPFCGANLRTGRALITLPTGRGTLLAASLLAFSAAGCGGGQTDATEPTDTTTEPTTSTEPSDPSANQNDDPPDQYDPQPADDNNAVAEYGVSPDDYADEPADDPPASPRYGLPPSRR